LSLFLFLIAGVGLALILLWLGEAHTYYTVIINMGSTILFLAAFVLMEYSIHAQRIERGFLAKEVFRQSVPFLVGFTILIVLFLVSVILFHARLGVSINDLASGTIPDGKANTAVAELVGGIHLYFTAILCVTTVLVNGIFGVQRGVIRQNKVIFILLAFLQILVFLAGSLFKGTLGVNSYGAFFLIEALFTARVFQEYFFYRMHHLSDLHGKLQMQEKSRTELIKKVITSSTDEDQKIVQKSLSDFLADLKHSIPVPDHSFSAFLVYKKKGDLYRVDSPDFITGVASPLYKIEALKRIQNPELQKMILGHSFDTRAWDPTRFADAAVQEMISKKTSVTLTPLPPHYKGIHRLIVFYPIISKDEVIGFLVGFKNDIDRIFPQEEAIIATLISNLAVMFTIMAGKEIQEEKNRLDGEMNIARRIQTSIVPTEIPMPGYLTATTMVTASEVGGDLYDFRATKNGHFLDIADVSGHGLPAGITALIHMAAAQSALATSDYLDAKLPMWALYDIVNQVLCLINKRRIGSDKFMTCNVLCEKDGRFVHAGTHLIGMLFRAERKTVELLNAMVDKTAFQGISELVRSEGSEASFVMNQGDILLLYTDGAIEAKNQYDEQFGMQRLSNILLQEHGSDPQELIQKILGQVTAFAESGDIKKFAGHFADDISLIVLKKE
jgi:sigma-B regulation protein RsbU (phosphoserine phosphatase)